jgi:phosphate uptake regulator
MKIEEKRKIVSLGHSKILTLPPWWLRLHHLGEGDTVMVSSEEGELLVTPSSK